MNSKITKPELILAFDGIQKTAHEVGTTYLHSQATEFKLSIDSASQGSASPS